MLVDLAVPVDSDLFICQPEHNTVCMVRRNGQVNEEVNSFREVSLRSTNTDQGPSQHGTDSPCFVGKYCTLVSVGAGDFMVISLIHRMGSVSLC